MKNSRPAILYIEDNVDNRKLVSRVLIAAGYTVYGVGDGHAGLDFVASRTPDLILVDIQLPTIDGYTVITEMRKQDKLNHVPIVVLTANVMRDEKEKSFASGGDGFIQKPIDVDMLPQQIQAFLANKGENI